MQFGWEDNLLSITAVLMVNMVMMIDYLVVPNSLVNRQMGLSCRNYWQLSFAKAYTDLLLVSTINFIESM